MAQTFICDGCSHAIAEPIKVGYVLQRDYCAACEPMAKRFVQAEEELRKATQERFIDERAALIANYSPRGFKLPDVP